MVGNLSTLSCVEETNGYRKRQNTKTSHEEYAEKEKKAGNFPKAIQPDDGYFGAAETVAIIHKCYITVVHRRVMFFYHIDLRLIVRHLKFSGESVNQPSNVQRPALKFKVAKL